MHRCEHERSLAQKMELAQADSCGFVCTWWYPLKKKLIMIITNREPDSLGVIAPFVDKPVLIQG